MKLKAFILLTGLFFLFCDELFSQTKKIDSLLLILKTVKRDTNKVNILNKLSENLRYQEDFSKELEYATQAMDIANDLKFETGEAKAYLNIGWVYGDQGENAKALENFYASLRIYEKIGNKKMIAFLLQMVGATLEYLGNLDDALKRVNESLEIKKQIGDKEGIAQSLNSIGELYLGMNRDSEALESHFAALTIYEDLERNKNLKNNWGMPWSYECIGGVYKYRELIFRKTQDKIGVKECTTKALTNYLKGLDLYKKIGRKDAIAGSYHELGDLQMDIKNFSKAKYYFNKGLEASLEAKDKNLIEYCYFGLSVADSVLGNYLQAYNEYKNFIFYHDSLLNKENKKRILHAQLKYAFDKKEDSLNQREILTETKLNAQQKQKYLYWGGIVMLSTLSFFVFINFRNQKKLNRLATETHARQKSELELQHQQTVLNERLRISTELHDEVGATLSGIVMYSHLTKEQIKKGQTTEIERSLNIMQQSSVQMVDKLSDIVWLINPEQDSLQKLVTRLEEYARDMAAIKNMQVKISVPEKIDDIHLPVENRRNIYLFCKEAINNAVKYSNASLLELTIKETEGKLEFSVRDNGKGFDAVMVRRGNGLENMQKRADEIGAKLVLQSKENEGASVSLQCKIT